MSLCWSLWCWSLWCWSLWCCGRSSFVVCRSSFVVCRSSFVLRRSPFHRSPFTVPSFILRPSPFVLCPLSFRPSFVLCPSSSVPRPSAFVVRPSSSVAGFAVSLRVGLGFVVGGGLVFDTIRSVNVARCCVTHVLVLLGVHSVAVAFFSGAVGD